MRPSTRIPHLVQSCIATYQQEGPSGIRSCYEHARKSELNEVDRWLQKLRHPAILEPTQEDRFVSIVKELANEENLPMVAGYDARSLVSGGEGPPRPSDLMRAFKQLSKADAEDLAARLKDAEGEHDKVDEALEFANELLGGYGIEPIRAEDYQVDRYYYDIIGLYVNFGDTYDATIVYDTEFGKFLITSWGDFYEGWRQEQEQEEDSEDEDEDDEGSEDFEGYEGTELKRIKRIRSHAGHAQFLAEVDDNFRMVIKRPPGIPSPYSYSPEWPVYLWRGQRVIIRETAHRQFDVFALPADYPVFEPEE